MIIRWRLLTRAQKAWAAATAAAWIVAGVMAVVVVVGGNVTRREIVGLIIATVLANCSTVCLKIENSRSSIDKAFMLGYQCRAMEQASGYRVSAHLTSLAGPMTTIDRAPAPRTAEPA